jgi:hypothetical protein
MVMPFGLTKAPTTFQTLMNQLLHKYLRKIVLVIFDDILVYSKTEKEHQDHLQVALELLRKNQLFANPNSNSTQGSAVTTSLHCCHLSPPPLLPLPHESDSLTRENLKGEGVARSSLHATVAR